MLKSKPNGRDRSSNIIRIDFSKVEYPDAFDNGSGTLASTIKPSNMRWLWHPYYPMGELSLVAAMGGVGKGLHLADITARVTTGAHWPFSSKCAPKGKVIWCEAEDKDSTTLVPRLIAAKADLSKIKIYRSNDAEEFNETVTRAYIIKNDVRMIVMSPLLTFLIGLENNNSELAVRQALAPWEDKLTETSCAAVGIMHLNKKPDLDAVQRVMGSAAFVNVGRSTLLMRSESKHTARIVHAKHNNSAKGDDMLIERVHRKPSEPTSQYVGINWHRADENVDVSSLFNRFKGSGETAEKWLVNLLETNGKMKIADIRSEAEQAGYNWQTIVKARQRNGEIAHKAGGFSGQKEGWWWLP